MKARHGPACWTMSLLTKTNYNYNGNYKTRNEMYDVRAMSVRCPWLQSVLCPVLVDIYQTSKRAPPLRGPLRSRGQGSCRGRGRRGVQMGRGERRGCCLCTCARKRNMSGYLSATARLLGIRLAQKPLRLWRLGLPTTSLPPDNRTRTGRFTAQGPSSDPGQAMETRCESGC